MRWGLIVLAVLAFLGVLFARLPLSWVAGRLPPQVRCEAPSGSIWQGRCGNFSATLPTGPVRFGALSWALEPAALLRARLAGTLQLEGQDMRGTAQFEAGSGQRLLVEHLNAELPFERRLIGLLPANWTGRARISDVRVRIEGRHLLGVSGDAQVTDLVAQGPRPDPFGSYRVHVPAAPDGSAHRAELQDTGGPLELTGSLTVQPDLNFELDSWVRARPEATPGLVRLISYLGLPDATGRRNFAASGNF